MRTFLDWLREFGVDRYHDLFVDNRIDLDIIREITDRDLESLGVPLGDRRRLAKLARELADQPTGFSEEALPPLTPLETTSEIRVITVMFADMVDSTRLAEELELEDYNSTLRRFFDTCNAIVIAAGGMPARYIGDALLACFGMPTAAEDDPVRAASAALEVARSVPGVTTSTGKSLRTRVGIATGVVMTSDLARTGRDVLSPATGATLNLAARLQALAAPGQVLIDNTTRRAVGRRFVCRFYGRQKLKGFAQEKSVWELESVASGDAPFRDFNLHGPGPMVNREAELDLMRARWAEATEKGSVLLISGEAGIGKTRLVSEFVMTARVAPDAVILMTCRMTDQLRPFQPVIRAILEASGVSAMPDVAAKRQRLDEWARHELDLTPQDAQTLAVLLSLSEGDVRPAQGTKAFRERAFGALTRVLAARARAAPIVIVIEDLQWVDPSTEEFFDHLVGCIGEMQALVVCTFRSTYTPNAVGEPGVSLIGLSRFGEAHAKSLLSDVMMENRLAPSLQDEILGRADGVPLFIEELTKSVLDGAADEAPHGAGPPELAAPSTPLPSTLLGSLLARLDRIPGMKTVAPIGAAVGRSFSLEVLLRITQLADSDVEPVLAELVSAGLLTRHGSGSDTRYTFRHALMQDAAYETLPRSRRVAIHGRIVDAFETLAAEGAEIRPGVLGHHAFLAERYEEACRYWSRAASQTRLSLSGAEAVAYIHAALGAVDAALEASGTKPDSKERIELEITLREGLYVPLQVTNWGSSQIADNMERLRQLREAHGGRAMVLHVLHGLAGHDIISGRVASAARHAEEILERYADDDVARVLGLRSRGFCRFLAGEFDDAIDDLAACRDLAHLVGRDRISPYYQADTPLVAQCMIAWAYALKGEKTRSEEEARKATAMLIADDVWSQAYALTLLASAYQVVGDVERCLDAVERAIPVADECRSEYWGAWNMILRGWLTAHLGSVPQGIVELKEGIERYRATEALQTLPYAMTMLADAYLTAGDLEEAREVIDTLTLRREPPEVRYVDGIVANLAARLEVTAGC